MPVYFDKFSMGYIVKGLKSRVGGICMIEPPKMKVHLVNICSNF